MIVNRPLITSVLDGDLYDFTVGSLVFHYFPRVRVTYAFKNRNNTPFPENFASELKNQLMWMESLTMKTAENDYLHTIPFLRPTYIEWLASYRFDSSEIQFEVVGTELRITIGGYWYRTIFWEVRLMALISELYFILTGAELDTSDFSRRTVDKTRLLVDNGCHWIDFGTRRRFSYQAQDLVQQVMHHQKGFLGTSNVHFAMKYGTKAHGTYSHQGPMGVSAKYGVLGANAVWMKLWAEHYNGNLGVALTDTYTTGVFLKDFGCYEAKLYDGVRHDSNDPYEWADKMIEHYSNLGIDPTSKRAVFSDNLKVASPEQEMVGKSYNFVALANTYRGKIQAVGGIGTYFTNDCGYTPLNMVVKLSTVDFGNGPKPVVKISDEQGKYTGDPKAVERALEEIASVKG